MKFFNASRKGGAVAPSLLAFAVDLSKSGRRGSLPASKGLAFLRSARLDRRPTAPGKSLRGNGPTLA